MTPAEFLINDVPDPEAARRFLAQLKDKYPTYERKLTANEPLLSDVLILVSCSPLFAATILHDPEHIAWLDRERKDASVRDKQSLLESLARFSLTHSLLDPHAVMARFRRRELMRVFLKDVRRLATIAEITDEISNLADAILEHALRLATQQLDNRFGQPQEVGERGRVKPTEFCIVSLGKLGSKELNYSSDIDLLFIYSSEGHTSGTGTRGRSTNLEYYTKLAETIVKLVGGQGGEGAAYRVDLRLRPHGRVGPLALSLSDATRYYISEAAAWERQVLIRSRVSAGSDGLFQKFLSSVRPSVFQTGVTVQTALENVRSSKQKIDLYRQEGKGIDIKLGKGGIREIEFIAQALQLAYGGRDEWLRVPHTLVSLDRLTDRGYLTGPELTQLYEAYDFLRRVEHILQIENGLQTHLVPTDHQRRSLITRRLGMDIETLDRDLLEQRTNVQHIFDRVFGGEQLASSANKADDNVEAAPSQIDDVLGQVLISAPRFLPVVRAHREALIELADLDQLIPDRDYFSLVSNAVSTESEFGRKLQALRVSWYRCLIEIVLFDAYGKLKLTKCKELQTKLAEASIAVALKIAAEEVQKRYDVKVDLNSFAVLALGKLGSGGLDYDSDLDLVFVYDDLSDVEDSFLPTHSEHYARLVEIFTNILSSITRDGHLYRVDLRLRPYGSDGPLVISRSAIIEYFRKDAAIWELLAYVNLRAVGGNLEFANACENDLRNAIRACAESIDPTKLAAETRSIRDKLEKQNASRRSGEIDIKFGPGGLLDVYFSARYLQLRHNYIEGAPHRSTPEFLRYIIETRNCVEEIDALKTLQKGYEHLTSLDHSLRVFVGRSAVLSKQIFERHFKPQDADSDIGRTIANLNFVRLEIRAAYDEITTRNNGPGDS